VKQRPIYGNTNGTATATMERSPIHHNLVYLSAILSDQRPPERQGRTSGDQKGGQVGRLVIAPGEDETYVISLILILLIMCIILMRV
jgi:hypothetical protein